MFQEWCNDMKHAKCATVLIIPGIFGPFGVPQYNSVVSTFCYQVATGKVPSVTQDVELSLIYIAELTQILTKEIDGSGFREIAVLGSKRIMVSDLLRMILSFGEEYSAKGSVTLPDLKNPFELQLFNTFRCYLDPIRYPVALLKHRYKLVVLFFFSFSHFYRDEHGSFVELTRAKSQGQCSISVTLPGITQGNHFHMHKVKRLIVIRGCATIKLRRVGFSKIYACDINATETGPAYVDIPVWHTHNISNTGQGELLTFFWVNEPCDGSDSDTYCQDV